MAGMAGPVNFNLVRAAFTSPITLANTVRKTPLGADLDSMIWVLKDTNERAKGPDELNTLIAFYNEATDPDEKLRAARMVALHLQLDAERLAPIVAQASGNFLRTVRFAPREKVFAKISGVLKASAVHTSTKNIIFGAELTRVAEAGFEKIKEGMLDIPGGTFQVGYDGPDALDWKKPVHEVRVSPFQMDQTPVMNRDYGPWVESLGDKRFFLIQWVQATGWPQVLAWGNQVSIEKFKSEMIIAKMQSENLQAFMNTLEVWEVELNKPPKNFDRPFQPRVLVSQQESYLYAFMHGTRLATSVEWAYAASEGGKKRFATPTGEFDASVIHSSVEKKQTATADVNRPDVVAGPYGLIDMNGNVWEWTMDRYGDYSPPSAGPVTGETGVFHGGSWFNDEDAMLLSRSFRDGAQPSLRSKDVGFRLVRPLQTDGGQAQDSR